MANQNQRAPFIRPNPWSNVHVAEGGNLQAQIDAAAAAYTATGIEQLVLGMELDDRSHTPAIGVRVVFLEDILTEYEDRLLKKPLRIAAPAAVVWRIDDGNNTGRPTNLGWWFEANATLGVDPLGQAAVNSTPFDYLRRRGIIPSLAMPSGVSYLNATNMFSSANLIKLVQDGAWEIMCHSADHTTAPSTAAAEIAQIATSKTTLETALAGSLPTGATVAYWDKVRAFIAPGGASGWNAILETVAGRDTRLGRRMKRYYEAFQENSSVLIYTAQGVPLPRYSSTYVNGLGPTTSDANVDLYLSKIGTPGSIVTLIHHEVVNSGQAGAQCNVAQWKRLAGGADGLGGVYGLIKAGKLICVPLSRAVNCSLDGSASLSNILTAAAQTTLFGAELANKQSYFWGGIVAGLFDSAFLDYTIYAVHGAVTLVADSVDPNALHPWAQGYHAKFLYNAAPTDPYLNLQLFGHFKPGRYLLKFDLKKPTVEVAAGYLTHQVTCYPVRGSSSNSKVGSEVRYLIPAVWETRVVAVDIPAWAQTVKLVWQLQVAEASKGVLISNLQMTEV